MFTQKELKKIKNIIDQYVYTDDEKAMKIASKVNDLIQLHDVWKYDGHSHIAIIHDK